MSLKPSKNAKHANSALTRKPRIILDEKMIIQNSNLGDASKSMVYTKDFRICRKKSPVVGREAQ